MTKEVKEESEMKTEDEAEPVMCGVAFEEFKEVGEVKKIIANIPNIVHKLVDYELGYERVVCELVLKINNIHSVQICE